MARDLREVRVIDVGSAKMSDVTVAALMRAYVQARGFLGRLPDIAVEEAGLTGRTVSAIETGNANPTWATVRDIAAALGVSMVELARLAEKKDETEMRHRRTGTPRNRRVTSGTPHRP